jgi:lipopolysaccharide heptosyltransferase I
MNSAPKVLIIRLSSLGDILHTVPALNSLRAAFPQARIDWLVEKRAAFLLSAVPGIDETFAINIGAVRTNPWSSDSWRGILRVVHALRARHYDLCFDFQGLIKTGLLSRLSRARKRFGFSAGLVREWPAHWFYNRRLDPPVAPVHIVSQNMLLAQLGGGVAVSRAVDLRIADDDERRIEKLMEHLNLKEFVVINPGGGWPTKRWSPLRYGALAARIQTELKLQVVVTTGPGEEAWYDSLLQSCSQPPPVHLQLPFLQLIPLLARAHLFIGGDTGPFHLACALRRPVVGLFGPTSPLRNGPWSAEDESVELKLDCSYCGGRSCTQQHACMDISVDEVFTSVVRRLERSSWKRADW